MARIKTRTLVVQLDDGQGGDVVEHDVQLRLVDQTRAELEGKRHGIDVVKHPLHLQGLFAWAACTRLGLFTGKWPEFQDVCVSIEDGVDQDVPPTETAASSA